MSDEPENFPVTVDALADDVRLRVYSRLSVDRLAGLMILKLHDGTEMTIGLRDTAMQTLCDALIKQSPKTPGTPGRN